MHLARSGKEAIAVARESLPDCAVIDLRLPDMSEWDVCREIRKRTPPLRRIWQPLCGQVLDYDTDAPSSMDDALLGFTTCPVCESDSVRSTLRVGIVQYYCCNACAFRWRAELLTPKA